MQKPRSYQLALEASPSLLPPASRKFRASLPATNPHDYGGNIDGGLNTKKISSNLQQFLVVVFIPSFLLFKKFEDKEMLVTALLFAFCLLAISK
jgi:hypothetical protein